MVIAVLDTLFAAFALAQTIAASGNGAEAIRRAGLTYADYARSGFFQLLWVAGISLAVLILFSRVTRRGSGSTSVVFQVLMQISIVLTLVIVAVAFRRLSLYEEIYGFTMLRLYSHIFAVWIGLVFALLAVDLLGFAPTRRWLVGTIGVTGLAVLLVLNLINPEALVVSLNIDRAIATGKFDTQYLETLSSDSIPDLASAQSRLPPDLRGHLVGVLCKGTRAYGAQWAALNFGDWRAAQTRRRVC